MVCVGPVVLMGLTFFGRVRSNGSCSGVRCTYHPAPRRNSARPVGYANHAARCAASRPPCASARIQRPPPRAALVPSSMIACRAFVHRPGSLSASFVARHAALGWIQGAVVRRPLLDRGRPPPPYGFATLQVFVCYRRIYRFQRCSKQ